MKGVNRLNVSTAVQEIMHKAQEYYNENHNYRSIIAEIEKGTFETVYESARYAYEQGVKIGIKSGVSGALEVMKEKIRG